MSGVHPVHEGDGPASRSSTTGFAGMTAGAFPDLARAPGAPAPPDIVGQMHRLELLHAAGALTDTEYDDARTSLLERTDGPRRHPPPRYRPLGA